VSIIVIHVPYNIPHTTYSTVSKPRPKAKDNIAHYVANNTAARICAGGICGPSGVESLNSSRLPVVFVYTVVPKQCVKGLPVYIKTALQQAIFTQPDCDVLLVSNFQDCASVRKSVESLPALKLVDSTLLASQRTLQYHNVCSNMFMSDGGGELWMTAALRFFVIEDLMREAGYTELVHVEADNMLYGKLSSLLPVLRADYPGLAATPLTAHKLMITASVFWISQAAALSTFNDYLMSLGEEQVGVICHCHRIT
jgi:hypothetical protein